MSRYIILTKVMLKNFNLLSLKADKPDKSRIKGILLPMIVFIAVLPIMFGIGTMVYGGYDMLSEIQQEGLILGIGFSVVSMTIFFFSIFYVMSVFYFSKDIESLLPLPLKPSEILAAKFTVTLFYEYLTESAFLAPVLIGFGAASRAGIMYYLYSLLIFLTLPLLPLIYASILSMLVMRFTNLAKNRDRFRIVGGIIAMFLAVGMNAVITKFSSASLNAEELQQLMAQGNNSFVGIMSGIFFSNRFAVMALLHSEVLKGFVNLAVFMLICLLFMLLFLSFGEGMYFEGVVGMSEASAKRKKYSEAELRKSSEQKSALWAYTMKELKLLFRTPIYFMNCVLMNFIFPIFIILPFLVQPSEMQELQGLSTYITNSSVSSGVLAVAFGISVFVTSTNGITASAISREGANIFVSKYLPISYKTQIMAKVLSGMSMGAVGTLAMMLSILVFIPVPVYLILLIIIASVLGITFSSFVGILFDLNFPKLIWDNEQKAIKQNFNVVLNMLVSVIIAGIPVFISIALHFTLWMTFLMIAAVFGILDLLLYNILSTIGVRLFEKIEG
ncbi:MAG: putative ABC transporter permease subunit [Clostridia bacterium]